MNSCRSQQSLHCSSRPNSNMVHNGSSQHYKVSGFQQHFFYFRSCWWSVIPKFPKQKGISQHFMCITVLAVPVLYTRKLEHLPSYELFLSWNRNTMSELDDKTLSQNSLQPTSQFLRRRAHAGVFSGNGWRGMGKASSTTLKKTKLIEVYRDTQKATI